MKKKTCLQGENVIWEIKITKAKLAKRRKTIELLQAYNQQDVQRLIYLSSYN
jgi:hypothetical protein